MKYFLGLDIALANNGICLIDNDANIIISDVLKTTNNDIIEERIKQINNTIYEFIIEYDSLEDIYLEGLSFGSSGRSFSEICGVHYCLRYFLYMNFNDINLKIIEPTKLKKFITGKGQCKKDLILLNVYKKFGVEFDNDNLADAYSLSRIALEDFKIKNS